MCINSSVCKYKINFNSVYIDFKNFFIKKINTVRIWLIIKKNTVAHILRDGEKINNNECTT